MYKKINYTSFVFLLFISVKISAQRQLQGLTVPGKEAFTHIDVNGKTVLPSGRYVTPAGKTIQPESEIFPDADVANVHHGNNLFYASVDNYIDNTVTPNISINLRENFYPSDGVGKPDPTDLISTGVNNLNPMFMTFDGKVASPNGFASGNNFKLQSGSPAYGSGNSKYNLDLGAYTSDGKGNKH